MASLMSTGETTTVSNRFKDLMMSLTKSGSAPSLAVAATCNSCRTCVEMTPLFSSVRLLIRFLHFFRLPESD